MIRLFVGTLDITDTVKSVSLEGNSTQFHRTLTVELIASVDGRKPSFKLDEGQDVAFLFNDKIRFRGVLFSQEIGSDGSLSIKAYDSNVYLTKNTDSKLFREKKASEILTILARDFGIPTGTIADTGYVIPYLRLSNLTLRDMVLKALTITQQQTGKRFFLGNENGKLTLNAGVEAKSFLLASDGQNLMSATYSRSIDDTKTQVKVIGGPKGKETVVVVKDDAKRAKYGALQAYEEMDEKATPSQIKQRATTLLREQSGVKEQLTVEVLGVITVDIGTAVYVRNAMTGTNGGYYVTNVRHNIANSLHTMELELTRTYELPDIDLNDDELKPETVKQKAKRPAKKEVTKK
ncbi:XkdQ/YqbQ family protein [Solibacillus ferritrahens]|uniref:XkdQ/YqbQ family protein n=1 Tax=Solibacillus ferritrahens TaxID=3098620 RepID=UPI00300BC47A